ncbi:hypothetical protein BDB00DRAFT_840656 [Zychaea mexicana]|uniref:uncharacterized protein n=1 Tax=Zychaea mexicana TaxID=64656 RepID=UPI0022FE9E1D|nr:uncharacterized protein BDB00DRAFT_840656 [Zychaea mexicana]KAI9489920.1 hypothetical protein BDB00DRAFT_840656 [Zychaea mexicana]
MEAEAFLLNENAPGTRAGGTVQNTATTQTMSTPPMSAFEIRHFSAAPPVPIPIESNNKDQQTMPINSTISVFQANENHISMVPTALSTPSSASSGSSGSRTTAAQRRQANRMREPIFVTEAPQNAYKKKKSRSASSDDDDSDEDAAQLKKLTSKQRRQMRNKISARNFRVRRKEYIEQLEAQVERQDKELLELRTTNSKLEKANQELFQELQYWRTMIPTPPGTTSSSNNSTSDNATSSPEVFPILDLEQFSLFDFSGNTHLAHAAIPDFDFTQILQDKKLIEDGSGDVPEDHERDGEGNIVLKPSELIKVYPLFVPALMSMIVRHTFTLHYAAYFNSILDLPVPVGGGANKMLDLLGQQEWMQAFTAASASAVITASGNRRRGSDSEGESDKISLKTIKIDGGQEEGAELTEEEERGKVEAFMRQHYIHYTFWRMCGLSHEQVYQRFLGCYRSHHSCAQKFEKKTSKNSLQRQASTLSAFLSVSNTVLHHPERLPLIASVLKHNSLTKINMTQQRAVLGLPSPSSSPTGSSSRKRTGFPMLRTIKLGGRKD